MQKKWIFWLHAFASAIRGQGLLYLVFTSACVGLLYARALLSIFAGILFGVLMLNLLLRRDNLTELRRYPAFIALMCIPLIYVFSGIQSDNLARWAALLWENNLYLFIPMGFYTYRHAPANTWIRLLMIFVVVCILSALQVLIDYSLHFTEYNNLYKVGKTIPTPVIHVRYSYFMAIGSCLAFALAYESHRKPEFRMGIGKSIMLVCGIFLAIFVHILAVRTGLIALYGGIAVALLCLIFKEGRWRLGMIFGAVLILLLFSAYSFFPSIQNKIAYVVYDLKMWKEQGAQAQYSDNVRITSIRHGLLLVREKLITGTGIGDLNTDMDLAYAKADPDFPVENRYPPISQYIYWLAAFGVAGFLFLMGFLLYPLRSTPFNYFLIVIYGATLFSAIGETTIELQLGKTTFLMLVCLGVLHVTHAGSGFNVSSFSSANQ